MEEVEIEPNFQGESKVGNKDKSFKFTYFTVKDQELINIFGEEFVNNNKDKCNLIIDDIINCELRTNYTFPLKGEHNVKLVINDENINFSGLFDFKLRIDIINSLVPYSDTYFNEYLKQNNRVIDASSLVNLDTSQCTTLKGMFYGCANIKNFNFLKNWDVSKCTDFTGVFYGCSFTKLDFLEKWDVSNGKYFVDMFKYCVNLKTIKHIKNWNIGNGEIFIAMFDRCYSLVDANDLQDWNMSKAKDISYMFVWCRNLTSIDSLYKWKLNDKVTKTGIIQGCKELKNIPSAFKGTDFCPLF